MAPKGVLLFLKHRLATSDVTDISKRIFFLGHYHSFCQIRFHIKGGRRLDHQSGVDDGAKKADTNTDKVIRRRRHQTSDVRRTFLLRSSSWLDFPADSGSGCGGLYWGADRAAFRRLIWSDRECKTIGHVFQRATFTSRFDYGGEMKREALGRSAFVNRSAPRTLWKGRWKIYHLWWRRVRFRSE